MILKTIALATLVALFTQSSFATFDSADFNEQKQLKINHVTPSGEDVPARRQIVLQFNRPVVPIGRMECSKSETPANIAPKLGCQWRWLNTSSLACQLDDKNKLKEATKYTITMNPGIRAEDGATIGEAYTHEFTTQRPQVRYAWFSDWQSPGIPLVRVTFNQSVSKSSVEKYIAFTYHKAGADKTYITHEIKVAKDPNDRHNPRYIVVPGESYVLDVGEGNAKTSHTSKSDNDPKEIEGEEARRIWFVSPGKELTLDVSIDLKVTPGLVSALGKETGVEDRTVVNFHTLPKFAFLGVTCTKNDGEKILIKQENSHEIGKCNPLKGTALSFSTPVVKSQIKNNVLIHPDLAGGRKDYDPWANRKGIVQAARYYFNRDWDTLNKKEMLTLIVLVRAPSRLDLWKDTERIESSINRLADQLIEKDLLSEQEKNSLLAQKSELEEPTLSVHGNEFVRYVKNHPLLHLAGWPHVKTTLDGTLQQRIQTMLDGRLNYLKSQKVHNGAALAVDHTTAEILVWAIGGKEITAQGGKYSWPLQKGNHEVKATVWRGKHQITEIKKN